MHDLVEYLMTMVEYVYTSMFIRWGDQVSTAQFDLAYAWVLCILAIAMIFLFSLVPICLKWLLNYFGKWGRRE